MVFNATFNNISVIYISYKLILHIVTGTVMAVKVCWLDLHLHMQSVPITIDTSVQHYVIQVC